MNADEGSERGRFEDGIVGDSRNWLGGTHADLPHQLLSLTAGACAKAKSQMLSFLAFFAHFSTKIAQAEAIWE